jgi:hypothetical protein
MHPVTVGALSGAEVAALRDVDSAFVFGGRRVYVWTGPELTDGEILERRYPVIPGGVVRPP